jgi:hypothetical protein
VPHDPISGSTERSDRSPWNWLLLVAIIVPLVTPLYNDSEPRLFGFPKFYWLQLALIGLGVACTAVVYRMTKRTTTKAIVHRTKPSERKS